MTNILNDSEVKKTIDELKTLTTIFVHHPINHEEIEKKNLLAKLDKPAHKMIMEISIDGMVMEEDYRLKAELLFDLYTDFLFKAYTLVKDKEFNKIGEGLKLYAGADIGKDLTELIIGSLVPRSVGELKEIKILNSKIKNVDGQLIEVSLPSQGMMELLIKDEVMFFQCARLLTPITKDNYPLLVSLNEDLFLENCGIPISFILEGKPVEKSFEWRQITPNHNVLINLKLAMERIGG